MTLGTYGAYIDGEQQSGPETFEVLDPATNQPIATVRQCGSDAVAAAIDSSETAFESWGAVEHGERARLLRSLAASIRDDADRLAEVETAETGRPFAHSLVWVRDRTAEYFEYYAGLAETIEGETIPVGKDVLDYTVREPLGVTGHVVPWNASLLLGARSIAPALACGNTVVVKPSPEAPLSMLELAQLASEAGIPAGVFNVVPGGDETGIALTTDGRLRGLAFTGSRSAGKAVMRAMSDSLVQPGLELGGKSPNLVFADADLERAVADSLKVFWNAGQVCFSVKSMFVESSIYEDFREALVEGAEALEVGPGAEETDVGPLISEEALDRVAIYVDEAVADGGQVHTGGSPLDREGNFYPPTIIDDVADDARISCEEVFGPVVTLYSFDEEAEAVERANDTDYGLYATVWTTDLARAHRLAGQLDAGTVGINRYPATSNRAPFGGYKDSGVGRVNGQQALDSYTQTKNVVVDFGE